MPQKSPTFLDELANAARGCVALLTGNRQAAMHFDFSHRGLAGSLIAFLIASAFGAFAPQLFGIDSKPGDAGEALLLIGILYLIQLGTAWLVLRQMGRLDGFVPFLVADNWSKFFITFLALVTLATPVDVIVVAVVIALGVVAIIIEINICRMIVTLAPLQIALFMVGQVVAGFIGLLLMGGMTAPAA